jgi:predicted Zn-dependent protease
MTQAFDLRRVLARVSALALLAALAAVPATVAAEASDRARQIERHLILAEHYELHRQDLAAAAEEYRAILALDRDHLQAGLALAAIDRQRGDAAASLGTLERLVARAPTHTPLDGRVLQALAHAREAAGDAEGARQALTRAARLAPADPEPTWQLFAHLERRYRGGEANLAEDLASAARGYLARSQQGSRAAQAELLLAELSGDELGRVLATARRAYEQAFTEQGIGRINTHMGRARQGFERCVREQPDREECHYRLGLVLSSVKASEHYNPRRARQHFSRAPSIADAHIELAIMHRSADELPAAATALERALSLAPRDPRAHAELGIVYKLDGRTRDAVRHFAEAIHADADHPAAGRALAELSALAPDHELARMAAQFGQVGNDVFSTEKFRSAVAIIERQMGGVQRDAPEQAILEEIAARIARAADVGPELRFEVAVLRTPVVNALALPNGNIYFTRGFFEFLAQTWPDRPIDANHDVLGHVMAHEMAHVIRRHTVRTLVFQEAAHGSDASFDPSLLTHVTRLHEIEADRDSIVMAFLAGYHPRGGIEFMEARGTQMEIPRHLSHPTYDERVRYLEEYWSNDVRYAYTSFQLGLDALDRAAAAESEDVERALATYQEAIEHFQRFGATLTPTVEILNNLGKAYARLGVFELGRRDSPLLRWQTDLSVEREQALAYVAVAGEAGDGRTRGQAGRDERVPWQLERAADHFRQAIAKDPRYARAHLNLAATYLAVGDGERAEGALRALPEDAEGDRGTLANLLGILHAERGDLRRAAAYFDRAGRYRSSHEASCFNFARLYQLARMSEQAKFRYTQYAERYPSSPWSRAARRALMDL